MSGLGKANQVTEKVIKRLGESFPKIIKAKQVRDSLLFDDSFNTIPPKALTASVVSLGEHYSQNAVKAVWNIMLEINAEPVAN